MKQVHNLQSRRTFLATSSALALAAWLPGDLSAQKGTAAFENVTDPVFAPTPKDASLKYSPNGTPRPFAGNTVICHLPQQCRFRDETAKIEDALKASSFAHKCGILPSNSYHMTIFPGMNDQDRATYGWPADLPPDLAIEESNRIIGERIAQFRMQSELPIRVKVDRDLTLGPQRVSSLRMVPADNHERAKLRTLRDRLSSEVFRFRTKDHDSYTFHISLAYQMSPLTPEEAREHRAILEKHIPIIMNTSSVLELGLPEFCAFDDMLRFEIRSLLRT